MRFNKYIKENDEKCLHFHKREKIKGRAVCSKCAKELEKIKSKNKED